MNDAQTMLRSTTLVVHAGGRGTRLRPYTLTIPKPLLKVGLQRKPLICYVIMPFVFHGIRRCIVTIRERSSKALRKLIRYVNEGDIVSDTNDLLNSFGCDRDFEAEILDEGEKSLGRGGVIKKGFEDGVLDLRKPIISMNGCDVARVNVMDLAEKHFENVKNGFYVTNVLASGFYAPGGIAEVDDRRVTKFIEKPPVYAWFNTGIFYMDSASFRYIMEISKFPQNLEDKIIPRLVELGKVAAYRIDIDDFKPVKEEKQYIALRDSDILSYLKPCLVM